MLARFDVALQLLEQAASRFHILSLAGSHQLVYGSCEGAVELIEKNASGPDGKGARQLCCRGRPERVAGGQVPEILPGTESCPFFLQQLQTGPHDFAAAVAVELDERNRPQLLRRYDHLIGDFSADARKHDLAWLRVTGQLLLCFRRETDQAAHDLPGLRSINNEAGDRARCRRRETGRIRLRIRLAGTHGSLSALTRMPSSVISGQVMKPGSRTGSSKAASPPVRKTTRWCWALALPVSCRSSALMPPAHAQKIRAHIAAYVFLPGNGGF